MKPSNACEFVDIQWCVPVSADVSEAIEAAFRENEKVRQKFDKAANMPKPSVASVWMALSDDQAVSLSEVIAKMPERFTVEQFWGWAADYRKCVTGASEATHILYLFSFLWEISEDFEPLHFTPELKKV